MDGETILGQATISPDEKRLTKSSFPSHYCEGRIEQIDVQVSLMTPEELRGSLWGNVIKYVMRWKFKGTPIEDLQKARTYLNWLIEYEEKEKE
jgi:hypothetical protein